MRLLAFLGVGLLAATLCRPAWAWLDSFPGGEYWPPIPGNAGLNAFLGQWTPQCNNGAWLDQDSMVIEPSGTLRYTARKPYFPTQYRVIEETPYGVTMAVRNPPNRRRGEIIRFWVLRRLDHRREDLIGINDCLPHDFHMKGFRWTFTDDELKEFWKGFATCNPALTRKDPRVTDDDGYKYWGDGWSQSCEFFRSE